MNIFSKNFLSKISKKSIFTLKIKEIIMNITYHEALDEDHFLAISRCIYDEVLHYSHQITKKKSHPPHLTFSEWKTILADIVAGFLIILEKRDNIAKNKNKIDRSLFLLCRYFYDLRN